MPGRRTGTASFLGFLAETCLQYRAEIVGPRSEPVTALCDGGHKRVNQPVGGSSPLAARVTAGCGLLSCSRCPNCPRSKPWSADCATRVVGDVIEEVWLSGRKQPLKSSPAGNRRGAHRRAHRRRAPDGQAHRHRSGDRAIERSGDRARIEDARRTHGADHRITRSPDRPIVAHFIVHLGMTGRLAGRPAGRSRWPSTRTWSRACNRAGNCASSIRACSANWRWCASPLRPPAPSRWTSASSCSPACSASARRRSRARCSTRSCCAASATSTPTSRWPAPAFVPAAAPPRSPAPTFTACIESVQQVLNEAIAAGGSSVSDYVDAAGEPGFFQFQHRVYGREGEPCLACRTPIKRVVIAGRSSHYCPKCQK